MPVCDSENCLVDSRVDCMYFWKLRCGGLMYVIGRMKRICRIAGAIVFFEGECVGVVSLVVIEVWIEKEYSVCQGKKVCLSVSEVWLTVYVA